jgi:hypothetical protein
MVFEACQQIVAGNVSNNATEAAELIAECPIASNLAGGVMGGLMAVGILVGVALLLLLVLAFYVYTSLAWYNIARKLKHKSPWLAWIPVVRWAMVLQLGGFHWAWFLLILIPILGWVALLILLIISSWKIYEKRKYPGWFSLAILVPELGGLLTLIIVGFVAWKDRKKMLFS